MAAAATVALISLGACSGPSTVSLKSAAASKGATETFCSSLFGTAEQFATSLGIANPASFKWATPTGTGDYVGCRVSAGPAGEIGVSVRIEAGSKPSVASLSVTSGKYVATAFGPGLDTSGKAKAYLQAAIDRVTE